MNAALVTLLVLVNAQHWALTADTTGTACPTSRPAGYTSVNSFSSLAAAFNSGQNLWFPSGSYGSGGSKLTVKPGVKVVGAGRDAVIVSGAGFTLSSNAEIRCIETDGTNGTAKYDSAFSSADNTTGMVLDDLRIDDYVHGMRGADGNNVTIADTQFEGNDYGYYGPTGRGSVFERNSFTEIGWAGLELQAAYGATIRGNTTSGGVTGIKLLAQYSSNVSLLRHWRDNLIEGNKIRGFSEEGISIDIRGNSAPYTTTREVGAVEAASGDLLVLKGWENTGAAYTNRYVFFWDGPCKGEVAKIASHNQKNLTLAAGSCDPAAGDVVAVGLPAIGNTIRNNVVDASSGITGIDLWGFTQDTTVAGNTITGPNSNGTSGYLTAAIRFASLAGIAADGTSTSAPCGRLAPSDKVTVQDNRIGSATPKASDRIIFESRDYSGCRKHYTPKFVTNSGNAQPTRLDYR